MTFLMLVAHRRLCHSNGEQKASSGGIRFHDTNQTVDFDKNENVSELPKRQFRKTGAPKFTVDVNDLDDDEDEDER